MNTPKTLGPTEVRPGTHRITRNLAPMMLAAKARKTLRPSVVPEMMMGDALLFDYRILHRGRANISDKNSQQDDDGECQCQTISAKNGRDRPVLVLTFARRWFVDVCNFPKRSIFEELPQKL